VDITRLLSTLPLKYRINSGLLHSNVSRHSASLVPVLSFGENEVYDLVHARKGSHTHAFQQKLKNMFGWTIPLFSGRGVFNCMLPEIWELPFSVTNDPDPW
jgi:2-acylglycerol O-acyltransferase 2